LRGEEYYNADAGHIEKDVGEGRITAWDIGLVDFVGDGDNKSEQSSNK
jgi:hypothetical protein